MLLRTLILTAAVTTLTTPLPAQSGDRQLAEAQRAAWGRPGSTTYRIDDDNVTFSGGRLVQTRFGPVLIAEGKPKEFGHPTPGRIGAFYIRRTPSGFARGRDFEAAVTGGSMGSVGEWSVSNAFAANPVIFNEGGMSNMGSTCNYTTLTELTPRGPVQLASFQSYGSYDGSGGGRTRAYESTGKIANIVRDRSFDVVFTGTNPGRDRYVRVGAKYRLQSGKPHLNNC